MTRPSRENLPLWQAHQTMPSAGTYWTVQPSCVHLAERARSLSSFSFTTRTRSVPSRAIRNPAPVSSCFCTSVSVTLLAPPPSRRGVRYLRTGYTTAPIQATALLPRTTSIQRRRERPLPCFVSVKNFLLSQDGACCPGACRDARGPGTRDPALAAGILRADEGRVHWHARRRQNHPLLRPRGSPEEEGSDRRARPRGGARVPAAHQPGDDAQGAGVDSAHADRLGAAGRGEGGCRVLRPRRPRQLLLHAARVHGRPRRGGPRGARSELDQDIRRALQGPDRGRSPLRRGARHGPQVSARDRRLDRADARRLGSSTCPAESGPTRRMGSARPRRAPATHQTTGTALPGAG